LISKWSIILQIAAAADSLSRNRIQQKIAWADLSRQATYQKAPFDFNANVGSIVPKLVKSQDCHRKGRERRSSAKVVWRSEATSLRVRRS
jgi:hypothetical protein